MKKSILFFVVLCTSTIAFPQYLLKVGPYAGAYFPNDKLLKTIYGDSDLIYGLKLGIHVWDGFFVFISGMQYKTTGETTGELGDIARLAINPINLSLRYTTQFKIVNPYLQIGYTHIYFSEESDINNTKDDSGGYCLQAGVEFRLSKHFIIDLGGRYSQVNVRIKVTDVKEEKFDLGGFQIGLAFFVFL